MAINSLSVSFGVFIIHCVGVCVFHFILKMILTTFGIIQCICDKVFVSKKLNIKKNSPNSESHNEERYGKT